MKQHGLHEEYVDSPQQNPKRNQQQTIVWKFPHIWKLNNTKIIYKSNKTVSKDH